MGVSAIIKDGVIQDSGSANSLAGASKGNNSTVGKDNFLQLLVAQMKYQDPLEPTSNTEWVSQYATFSELEEMQNMAGSLELTRASSYVGKTVQINSTDSEGNTTYVQGNVDYVTYEAGKAYLSVNGELYALSDLVNVVDPEYLKAGEVVANLVNAMKELPDITKLVAEDKDKVDSVKSQFDAMSEYQKSFLPEEVKEQINSYVKKISELISAKENSENDDNNSEASSEEKEEDSEA